MHLPAKFGKYELIERIATGGMAEVYLARSFGVAGFERRLVIKLIRPEHAQDPRFISLFINEAKIGVHLNHPNIVQVYELNKVNQTYYIAMEQLRGCDLNKLVKTLRIDEEQIDLPVAVAIVAEACRGLAFAHNVTDNAGEHLGLVHRDVSPHNLFVTFAGEVKLMDFGIARLMNTEQGRIAGSTPGRPGGGKYAYMSPEQAHGTRVDRRTDVFSAAIVLWELIVGHRLYQDPDPTVKLEAVKKAEIPHPNTFGADIDDALWGILCKALSRDPKDRYATAAAMEEELRTWIYGERSRVEAANIPRFMQRTFPSELSRGASQADLRRIAEDVDRLGGGDSSATSEPTQQTGASESTIPDYLVKEGVERKRIAVLVADVDGLTSLSERSEPEALFKTQFQLLRWVRRIVDRHGGMIQRAIDDQIYIFFGVPRNRNDDLERALDCGLELQSELSVSSSGAGDIHLSIGAHVGEVTVDLAHAGRIRYTARGDTTRLARRLSNVADHGQVLLSEEVMRAAANSFRVRRGPEITNRGGRLSLPSYILQGKHNRFRTVGKGPWIRPQADLAPVRDALERLETREGKGVVILGEQGIGKSRMIQEILRVSRRRELSVYYAAWSPFGDTLQACREMVKDMLGVRSARNHESDLVERLAHMGLYGPDLDAVAALLGDRRPVHLDIDDVWVTIRKLIDALSHDSPLIVVFENLDNIPESQLPMLDRTVARSASVGPALFLLTGRTVSPDALPSCEVLQLEPFGRRLQVRLLKGLLSVEDVETRLVNLVTRTCEGNPLYIEEMVKFLLQEERILFDEGTARLVAAAGLDLPESIAGLISARLDALDPAAKGVLRMAAIIGHHFSVDLLGRAIGLEDPLPIIGDLEARCLVTNTNEQRWTFGSEFVREAALRGVLGVQRREYHRLVANAIEGLHREDLDPWSEQLAEHCGRGGRFLDAARFAFRAGEGHEARQDLAAARRAYRHGLDWLERVIETPDTWDARVQGEAMLHYRFGAVSLMLGDTRVGERALHIALDVASDCGLPTIEARAHLEFGRYHMEGGRPRLANAHLSQAMTLATLEDEPDLHREVLEVRAVFAHQQGDTDESMTLWRQALELAKNDPADTVRALIGLANGHLRAGDITEAATLLGRARLEARRAGDRIAEGRVLNNLGLVHVFNDEYEDALDAFRRALQIRENTGYSRGIVINHHNIGDVHFMQGDFAKAYMCFRRSQELAEQMAWGVGMALNEVYLAYINGLRSLDQQGLNRLREATEHARDLKDADIALTGEWLTGRLLLELGRIDDGRELLSAARREAAERGQLRMVRTIDRLLAKPVTTGDLPDSGEQTPQ